LGFQVPVYTILFEVSSYRVTPGVVLVPEVEPVDVDEPEPVDPVDDEDDEEELPELEEEVPEDVPEDVPLLEPVELPLLPLPADVPPEKDPDPLSLTMNVSMRVWQPNDVSGPRPPSQ
jgi:hypothetical protein